MHDLVIRNGLVVDGTGAPRTHRRHRGRRRASSPRVGVGARRRRGTRGDRRDRHDRHAGLRRHPHPLRRPGDLGSHALAVGMARRDHAGDGQLRRRVRARGRRPARLAHGPDGRRRGDPARRARRGPALGLGDVPRVPRRHRRDAEDGRRRRADPARPAARVRDARARHPQRARDPRRDRAHGRARRGRRRGGRARRSRRRAPCCTAVATTKSCPARSRTKTSSSRSAARSRASAAACSRSRPSGIQGEDTGAPDRELDWMRRLAQEIERPVTFGFVQHDIAPDDWRHLLDAAGAAADDGIPLRPQVTGRPVGLVLGLQTRHPLFHRPTFTALSRLPLDERVAPPARPRRPRPHPERDADGRAARLLRHGPRPHLRARRPARLRAAAGDERDGARGARGRRPRGAALRPPAGGRRARSCCCARCSGTATATSTRCTRCSWRRAACSASATAARTCA